MEATSIELQETTPKENLVRLSFRFEPHHGREKYRVDHVENMNNIFRKDERNIMFLENSSDDYTAENNIREGFDRFPKGIRFSSAYAYACLRREGAEPEKIDYNRISDFVGRVFNAREPMMGQYILRKMLAADKMESDGYTIEPLIEGPQKKDVNNQSRVGQLADKALDNLAKASSGEVGALATQLYARNQEVIKQLEEIKSKASTKTNIYVVLGTAHNTMMEDLPEDLKESCISASTDDEKVYTGNLYEELYKKSKRAQNGTGKIPGMLSRMMPRFNK